MGSTIDDVAARAGVSTATVSRALRGLSNVSEQARARVLRAAEELGYVVSPSAQALATGRTRTVALIVPSFSEWFISHVLDGAQRRFQALGYSTVVHSLRNVRGKPPLDFDLELIRRRVDGVVIIGIPLTEAETREVATLGVPVVMVGNLTPPFPSVGLDDVEVGLMATRHLIGLGHRVIAHISASDQETTPLTPSGGRLAGWHRAMEEAGLEHGEDLVAPGFFDVTGGHDAMAELIDRRPDVTAVFAAADCIAVGALLAMEERGLRAPEDVSVIGVDGEAQIGWRSLTTVVQNPDDQGRMSADELVSMVNGGAVARVTAVHGVLMRGTTTSVPRQPGAVVTES